MRGSLEFAPTLPVSYAPHVNQPAPRFLTRSGGHGRVHFDRTHPADSASVWRDDAARPLVGAAAGRVPRSLHLPRLLDVGRVSGRALHVRTLPLAVLLSRDL